MGKKKDTEIINEWILLEKTEKNRNHENRDGYMTNLSRNRYGEMEDVFGGTKRHRTIRAVQAFDKEEQVKVTMETVHATDRENGIRYFLTAFHNHDFFEMIYVYRGQCTTTIEGKAGTLYEGDICIYNLEAVHQLGVEDENSVVFNIIMKKEWFYNTLIPLMDNTNPISGFFIKALYHIASPAGHLVFSLTEGGESAFFLNKLIAEFCEKKEMYQNMIYTSLSGLFISLARQYESRIADRSIGEDKVDMIRIINYISMNYRDITLKTLAEYFNYTERTMMRLIRKYTYRTFTDIVMEFRMNRACLLLKENRLSVEEITAELGYGDRSYFDRVFGRYYHMTPARYRKEYGK